MIQPVKSPASIKMQGARQWRSVTKIGNPHGASMRTLISDLNIHEVQMSPEIEKAMIDVDTPDDLVVAMEYLAKL